MAKRKVASRSRRGSKPAKRAPARKARPSKKPARRRVAKAAARKKPATKRATVRPAVRKAAEKRPVKVARPRAARRPEPVVHISRVERERRILEESVPTPPSSLNMDRRGTAARTGRAEIEEARENLGDMGSLTAGDVDANAENAYFSGDEAPGGDNPTPDQDVVDDIGRAMGVAYQDNEELRAGDKVADRDRHRWERDPASSEDYKDRK